MKYSFKFQGLVRNLAVFTVIMDDERGLHQAGVDVRFHHFKADENLNIQEVSYIDVDLAKCHTTEHRTDGSIVPARADLVTEQQTKGFLDTLIERNIEIEGIGKLAELDIAIIKNYALKITFPSGRVSYKYFDGVDLEGAIRKAKVNNQASISIEPYDGNMAGKLSLY